MEDINTSKLLSSLESMYLKKDFDNAIDLLLKNKEAFERGVFHYNLGTLYAKKGVVGASRYHLEKAIVEGYTKPDVYNNLSNLKKQVNHATTTPSSYDKAMDYILIQPKELFYSLSLILLISTFFCIRFNFFKSRVLIGACLIFSIIPSSLYYFHVRNVDFGIALKSIPVYEGPSQVYEKKIEIPEGSRVIIGKKNSDWYFVESPISVSGWIKSKNLGTY